MSLGGGGGTRSLKGGAQGGQDPWGFGPGGGEITGGGRDHGGAKSLGHRIITTVCVCVAFASIVQKNTTRIALIAARFRHNIVAKMWYTRYRVVYIWRNCWAYFKPWLIGQNIPFTFFLEVAFIDKTYSNALRHLLNNNIRSRLAFMRTSRKTIPLKSQSINNFSGIDISQSMYVVSLGFLAFKLDSS